MKSNRSLFRAAVAIAGVALAACLAAGPVAADTAAGHTGHYGVHYLADSPEYAGARCRYDGDSNLDRIVVRDPFVFARDISPGIDAQFVQWRVIVQRQMDGSAAWSTYKKSQFHGANARDDRPANLSPIAVTFTPDTSSQFRALVRIRWLVGEKAVSVEGTATHRVDWYRYPLAAANKGFCPGFIF